MSDKINYSKRSYSGDSRYEEGKNLVFGHDLYLEIYLTLQAMLGLNQKDLLVWIGESCDWMEANNDMAPREFNRRTKGRAGNYGKTIAR